MTLYLTLAARYLGRRRSRTALTTLSIVLGVMMIFGLSGVGAALKVAFNQSMTTASLEIPLLVSQQAGGTFDAQVVTEVGEVAGVEQETGVLNHPLILPAAQPLPTASGQPVTTLTVSGIDPDAAAWVFDIAEAEGRPIASGRALQPGDESTIILSENLAGGMGVGIGDPITLPSASGTSDFEVVGIMGGSGLILGQEQVYMPLGAAQRLFNAPGQVNTVMARFAADVDEEAVREAVLDRLGAGYQVGHVERGGSALASTLQYGDLFFGLFGVLTLAMAGFIMFNTFRTLVVERRRDIGMLRAIGASRRTVTGLVLTESLVQGALGTALGLLAGYGLAQVSSRFLEGIWQQFLSTTLGPPVFNPLSYGLAIGAGLGIPLVSAWLPARAASEVTPLEALRPSTAEVDWPTTGRRALAGAAMVGVSFLGLLSGNLPLSGLGVLLFLAGLILVGPALVYPIAEVFGRVLTLIFAREGRIAQGNLVRQPTRAAITASTMTISLAILITLVSVATSGTTGMIRYLDRSMRADYLLTPENLVASTANIGAGPELAEAVRALPGVAEMTTLRRTETQVGGGTTQIIGIDPATYPTVAGLTFTAGDEAQAYREVAEGRGLLINGLFATQAGVGVGDEVTLETAEGPQRYRVAGMGLDYLNAKLATAYLSHANLERDFHVTNDLFLLVNTAPEADRASVEAGLLRLAERYPVFRLFSTRSCGNPRWTRSQTWARRCTP